MSTDKLIMVELIPSDEKKNHLIQSVLFTLSSQGFLSFISTFLVYLEPGYANFLASNTWIFYLSIGAYVILSFSRFMYSNFEQWINQLILFLIIISCAIFDAGAGGFDPSSTFQAITFLFSGVIGVFIYSVLSSRLKAWYWGLIITFFAVDITLAGFYLSGFYIWDLLLFAAIALAYGGFIYYALNDVCERYTLKLNDWASAGIFIYFDILVLPFVLTTIRKCIRR